MQLCSKPHWSSAVSPLAKIALGYRPYVPAARLIAILAFGLVAVLVGVPYFR
jgi:hypothetical protein